MTLDVGQTFRGVSGEIYTAEAKIGTGGTAAVFRVTGSEGGTWAAKVLSGHRFNVDDAMRARFAREIAVISAVDHPNVLSVHDHAEASGARVLISELAVDSLFGWLEKRKREVPLPIALGFIDQTLAGVSALHDAGCVHRDLSPKNLMLREDGSLVVADFGTVRHLDDETLTSNQDQIGSLLYISSDQFDDAHCACPEDDVFSIGQIAWELLAGERPVGNPRPIQVVRPDLPVGLGEFIETMRSNDRADRPPSASMARRRMRDLVRTGRTRPGLSGVDEMEATLKAVVARQGFAVERLSQGGHAPMLSAALGELVDVLGPVRLAEAPPQEAAPPSWCGSSREAVAALSSGSLRWDYEPLTGEDGAYLMTVTNAITGLAASRTTNGLACLPTIDIERLLQAFERPKQRSGPDAVRSVEAALDAFRAPSFLLGRPCRDCGRPLELQQPRENGTWAFSRGTIFRAARCPADPEDEPFRCCVCGTRFQIVGGSDEWGAYDATGCECRRSLDLEFNERPWLAGEPITVDQVQTIFDT